MSMSRRPLKELSLVIVHSAADTILSLEVPCLDLITAETTKIPKKIISTGLELE